jgi:hypothetical protein
MPPGQRVTILQILALVRRMVKLLKDRFSWKIDHQVKQILAVLA